MVFFTVSVAAQDAARNYTDCDVEIKVAYDTDGDCVVDGFTSLQLGPTSSGNFDMPDGSEILYGKARYTGTGGACVGYFGQSCSPYPNAGDTVDCDLGCGDFGVSFNPAIGVRVYPL